MFKDFRDWIKVVSHNWAGYSTGGFAIAALGLWQIWRDKPILRKWALAISGVFFVVACFKAWRYQKIDSESQLQKITSDASQKRQESERKIQNLEAQLDDRKRKKQIETRLGDFHIRLRDRWFEIQGLSASAYVNKYEQSYSGKALDPNSHTLICEIDDFLSSEVRGASVAIWRDTTGLKSAPVRSVADVVLPMERYQQFGLDIIGHRAKQLMRIIEAKDY
jgi:hypothetical protein